MCTSSEIASQQMKTIQGGDDKQTEDVKKLSEKRAANRGRRKTKDGGKPFNPEKKNEKTKPENPPEPKCKYCGRKQRHVRRTQCPAFKQTCGKCQKRAISRLCVGHPRRYSSSKRAKMIVQMKAA